MLPHLSPHGQYLLLVDKPQRAHAGLERHEGRTAITIIIIAGSPTLLLLLLLVVGLRLRRAWKKEGFDVPLLPRIHLLVVSTRVQVPEQIRQVNAVLYFDDLVAAQARQCALVLVRPEGVPASMSHRYLGEEEGVHFRGFVSAVPSAHRHQGPVYNV